jgi:predicted MFS family arabinose efflux permease
MSNVRTSARAQPDSAGPAPAAWRRYLPVYWVLFLVGSETFLVSPLLPDIARGYRVTVGSVATVVTAYVLCYAAAAPVFGMLCDRYGRGRFVLGGAVTFLTGNLCAAIAPSLWVLVGARALAGLGGAAAGPAIWAYIGETSPDETRSRAIGVGMAFFSLGQVLGVPAGAFIAQVSSWHYSFAAVGAGLLVSVPLLVRLPSRPGSGQPLSARSLFSTWGRPDIRHALTVTFFFQAANLGAYTYLGSLLGSRFHLKVGVVGLVGVLVGAGSVAGSILGGRLGSGRRNSRLALLMTAWSLLLGGSLLVVASSSVLTVSVIAVLCWFVASGAFVTAQQTLIVGVAPQLRATSVSWNNTTMYVGTAVGVWLIGTVSHLGTGLAEIGATLAALAAVSAVLLARRLRPSPEPSPAAPQETSPAKEGTA